MTNLRRRNWALAFVLLALGFALVRKIGGAHSADAHASDSVLEMEVIPRTPERLARGKYLVDGVLWCATCHSEIDWSKRPLEAVAGTRFGGHIFGPEFGLPAPFRVVAPNISPDPDFGAGKWKDADFARALRRGIGHDGRTLFDMMPYDEFSHLSDEDLASVIVYLRSVPPVHLQRPQTSLPEQMTKGLQPIAAADQVPEPDQSDRVHYGSYLVTAGQCRWCHTPVGEKDELLTGMDFSGGHTFSGPFGPHGRQVVDLATLNLTPDPSGIPYFDKATFVKALRTGHVGARQLSTLMPWSNFRNLTDDDLAAIFAYLRTLTPVKHRVDNTEPPTYCKVCRHKHGYGNMN
jgi:hypothetical protein